jgi:hypothetical protein
MTALIDDLKAILAMLILMLLFFMTGCSLDDDHNPVSSSDPSFVEIMEQELGTEGIHTLDAETTNGIIEVIGTSSSRMSISIRKEVTAPTEIEAEEFARKVGIHIEEHAGTIRIYSKYPDPPHNVNVEVSYEIECPREIGLGLVAVNGICEVNSMRSSVHAAVINGYISAEMNELVGGGNFYVTNGYIDVGIHGGIAPLTAVTTNGNISVTLHRDFSGTFDASVIIGNIHCQQSCGECPIIGPCRITGSLGEGGPTRVVLSTTNGNISLANYP